MKFSQMTTAQKEFSTDVVFRTMDNREGKAHTKACLAKVVNAAFKNKFGVYPDISKGTIETILLVLKKAGRLLTTGTADGKGLAVVCSTGNNKTPRVFDVAMTIDLRQKQVSGAIANQIGSVSLNLITDLIPNSGQSLEAANGIAAGLDAGNARMLREARATKKITQTRFAMVPVASNGQPLAKS